MHLPALGGEDADRGLVDVAEEDPLDAALHEGDRAALDRGLGRLDLGQALERPARRRGRREREHRAQPRARHQRRELGRQRRAGHERAKPPRVREQLEDRLAVRALLPRARLAALHLRAHALDQLVVLHARRTRRHARHAAQAAVEVGDHLGRDLLALLVADAHEQDAPARGVHLLLEDRVARAGRQAEAAVHAVPDEVHLGRVVFQVPGGGHIPPTKTPGRKIRAGSKRAFRRSITAWPGTSTGHCSATRSAPSSTVQLRGASASRIAATFDGSSKASHESPSAARETTVAPFSCATRITFGRSVGRPETLTTTGPRWSARTSSQSTSTTSPARLACSSALAPLNCISTRPLPCSQTTSNVSDSSGRLASASTSRIRSSGLSCSTLTVAVRSGSGCSRTATVAISPSVPKEPANSFARS